MDRSSDRNRQLTAIALEQLGLFTLEQAIRSGFARSTIQDRVAAGGWERWLPAVYGRSGLPRTWRRRLLGGVLAAGPGAAAARESAAVVWHLPTARRWPIHIVVPYDRCVRFEHPRVRLHRSRTLVPEDVVTVRSVPTTVVDRTIAEVAGSRRVPQIAEMMAHAIRDGLVDDATLAERARLTGPIRGIGRFREARGRLDPQTVRSRAKREITLARAVAAAGLPRPVVGYELVDEGERLVAEIDLAFVAQRVAVEVDGFRWHSTPLQKRYDDSRQNRLILRGWRILRFSSQDVDERLDWAIRQIAEALSAPPRPPPSVA